MSEKRKGQRGAGLVEYVILLSFIAMAVIPAVKYFGRREACRECVNACAVSPPVGTEETWADAVQRVSIINGCAEGTYSVDSLCGDCTP